MDGINEPKPPAVISALAAMLQVSKADIRTAIEESAFNYLRRRKRDPITGRIRRLCYPPPDSKLYQVQVAIRDRMLRALPLVESVLGYIKGSHNISAAEKLCSFNFVGKLDISGFHPAIRSGHVATALVKHGIGHEFARHLARLLTFKGRLPQGGSASSDVANLIIDCMLRRSVLPFAQECGVSVVNFGDDTGFGGDDRVAVAAVQRRARRVFEENGFSVNSKSREPEHRGTARRFLGCATGRSAPDYPREEYRELRRALRKQLAKEKKHIGESPVTSAKRMRSIRQKIAYIRRLNRHKARSLLELFHRIRAARERGRPGLYARTKALKRQPKEFIGALYRGHGSSVAADASSPF